MQTPYYLLYLTIIISLVEQELKSIAIQVLI